jgi:SAM-dependent methyltransferase
VLDGGCGTGRVAIELQRRGFDVTGVDLDPGMLDVARAKAPDLTWHLSDLSDLSDLADLAEPSIDEPFDTVVLAGNVLIFVAPGSEARTVARCRSLLAPGGLLIAGFQLQPDRYGVDQLDEDAAAAGLSLLHRWSTWARGQWTPQDAYQVSVHQVDPVDGTDV